MEEVIEAIKESAIEKPSADKFTFWISNHDSGDWFYFADVNSVEQGRFYWTQIAHLPYCDLTGFEVRKSGETVYQGNYQTDEC